MSRNSGVISGLTVLAIILYLVGSLLLGAYGAHINNPILHFLASVVVVFANQLLVFIVGAIAFLIIYCFFYSISWLTKKVFILVN